MSEQRDNAGILFVNDRKENDNHPDRKGSAMINGVEYWVSGWIKKGNKGPFMSLAFKIKEERQSRPASKPAANGGTNVSGLDDDIPF